MAESVPLTNFGRVLKRLRQSKGWSQQELADAAGVPQKSISNWESTTQEIEPGWDGVQAVADALGISVEEFRHPRAGA